MQKITPYLRLESVTCYGEAGAEVSGRPKGTVMTMTSELEGQEFIALNGGPHFTFSPAISFIVNCETQDEVDELWGKLSEGGEKEQCGWLKDKYGVSWQIVPTVLGEMLQERSEQGFKTDGVGLSKKAGDQTKNSFINRQIDNNVSFSFFLCCI